MDAGDPQSQTKSLTKNAIDEAEIKHPTQWNFT
jgi:hypothetical protein